MKTADLTPNIPQRARDFAIWYSLPPGERDPSGIDKLAEQLGCSPRTLRDYRLRDWWPALLREVTGDRYGLTVGHDMAVMDALHAKAIGGDNAAIKTYLELRGLLGPSSRVTDSNDVSELTDEQLNEKLARLVEASQAPDAQS